MALRSTSFSLQVGKFVEKAKRSKMAVFKESTKELVDTMQKTTAEGGRMPVITGFLRSTLIASTKAEFTQTLRKPDNRARYNWDKNQVYNKIDSLRRFDQVFSLSYTAIYAPILENKYGFMRLARQKWPTIVNRNIRKVNGGKR